MYKLTLLQLRTELDDAGLCPDRVELLWELYEKARASQEEQREAPAAALVEAGDLEEHPAPAASQVCSSPACPLFACTCRALTYYQRSGPSTQVLAAMRCMLRRSSHSTGFAT